MRAVATALVLVGTLSLGSGVAQAQQGDDCREVVRASATAQGAAVLAKFRGRQRAISRWRVKVTERYGDGFRTWLKAHQRTVDCNASETRTTCTAEAFPCRKF